MILGFMLALRRCRKTRAEPDHLYNLVLWLMPVCILCARAYYGAIRCFVEGLRTDSLYLMPGIRVSQVLSGCLILLGVLLVGIIRRRQDIQV